MVQHEMRWCTWGDAIVVMRQQNREPFETNGLMVCSPRSYLSSWTLPMPKPSCQSVLYEATVTFLTVCGNPVFLVPEFRFGMPPAPLTHW